MKRIAAVSCLIALFFGGIVLADDDEDVVLKPVQSSRCIVQGNFGCVLAETVYGVRGVSCVEDCLSVSTLNTCRLSNQCNWDAASGCFIKSVCVEISALNSCRRWERQALCR
ncbi:hypothetical protein [Imhoffiella purpurea]|uniref:hypothetical protein n=1 Tax=Imhoffiella purpurea TaxID=1249627 RepID=UPI0005C1D3AA|nr:hypothetical protein [Imhoffiella purpurea]